MANLTVYLVASNVFSTNVILIDSAGRTTTLTTPDFSTSGTGAHASERLANVAGFSASPSFQARLIVATAGAGKALVDFAIDGTDLPAVDALYADGDNVDSGFKSILWP